MVTSTLAGSALGFVFWSLVSRHLPPAAVGRAAAYLAAMTLATSLGEMGMGATVVRYGATATDRCGFAYAALAPVLAGTTAAAGALLLLAPRWSRELALLTGSPAALVLFGAATLTLGFGQFLDRLCIAFEAARWLLARNLLMHATRLGVWWVLAAGSSADSVLVAVAAGSALSTAASAALLVPRLVPKFGRAIAPAWQLMEDKASYALGNHLATLVWHAPPLVYPLVIAGLLGPEANARFYAAWMVANPVFAVPVAAATAAFTRSVQRGRAGTAEYWQSLPLTLAVLLPAVVGLGLAAPMIMGLFGAFYVEAAGLYRSLLISTLPYAVNTFTITALRARQQALGVVAAAGIVSTLALTAIVLLGRAWGLPGIGWGWAGAQGAGMIVCLACYRAGQPWSRRQAGDRWSH
jgi:O-antigen/teichoic acid export membrane protein